MYAAAHFRDHCGQTRPTPGAALASDICGSNIRATVSGLSIEPCSPEPTAEKRSDVARHVPGVEQTS
jgi:hypothetical protein